MFYIYIRIVCTAIELEPVLSVTAKRYLENRLSYVDLNLVLNTKTRHSLVLFRSREHFKSIFSTHFLAFIFIPWSKLAFVQKINLLTVLTVFSA